MALKGSILFRFDIKDPPRYGRLERLRGHEKWASTKRFYSRQLEKGKVRYVHTRGGSSSSHPSSDSFSFIVSVPASPSTDTHNNAMAVQEDSFKIDIISNVIRVRSTFRKQQIRCLKKINRLVSLAFVVLILVLSDGQEKVHLQK